MLYEDETILWRFALLRAGWWRTAQRARIPTRPLSPSQIKRDESLKRHTWVQYRAWSRITSGVLLSVIGAVQLARVNIDYHVEVDGHYYSVPYSLVKQQLDVRLSAQVVEIFHKGTRVASHQRSPLKGRHTTVAVHMPKAHQHYAEWTPQRLVLWATKTGEATA